MDRIKANGTQSDTYVARDVEFRFKIKSLVESSVFPGANVEFLERHVKFCLNAVVFCKARAPRGVVEHQQRLEFRKWNGLIVPDPSQAGYYNSGACFYNSGVPFHRHCRHKCFCEGRENGWQADPNRELDSGAAPLIAHAYCRNKARKLTDALSPEIVQA